MSSKAPTKIVGGLLAGLLALFAAVVVATPAWAVNNVTVNSADQFAASMFGSTYAQDGIKVENGVVTVPESYSKAAISSETLFYFQTPVQLVLNNTSAITLTNQLVVTGPSTLTISGTGALTNAGSNGGTIYVGSQDYAGHVDIEGVTVSATSGGCGVIVANGNATIDGGATINGPASKNVGAVQVGANAVSDAKPTCTIGEATVKGVTGAVVIKDGTLTVDDGANITGTGMQPSQGGSGVFLAMGPMKSAVNDATWTPTVVVNGGAITGGEGACGINAHIAGTSGNIPATAKASATITVNDGTVSGPGGGIGCAAVNGAVTVTGGTVTGTGEGTPALDSNCANTKVSGGQFSTPVPTSQLADSVKNMAVLPGAEEDEPSTYGYYGTSTPANATAVIPIGSTSAGQAATVDILAMVVNPNSQAQITAPESPAPEGSATNAVQVELEKLGITSGQLWSSLGSLSDNTLYVIYYGDQMSGQASGPTATAGVGSTSFSNGGGAISGSPTNGFNVAKFTITAAGTCTVSVSGGPGQSTSKTIDISGVTIYNPTAGPASGLASTTPVQSYYATNASSGAYTLPTINAITSYTTVGWYQLTPDAAGKSYNAALYPGTTWAPTSATMTTLMAAYTEGLKPADVTSSLAVSPTNVVNSEGAQATLTVTIKDTALQGAGISLANPTQSGLDIANEDDLETTMADLANGVVQLMKSATVTFQKFDNNSWSNWTGGKTSNAPEAALAENADGTDAIVVNGSTVTATFDIDCSAVNAATNAVALGQVGTLVPVGTATGTTLAPTLTQPAALFNVYVGLKAAAQGNGTVEQTVDAQGNVTLTAVPASGATFVGWQYPLGTNLFTTSSITLSQDAIKSLTTQGSALYPTGASGVQTLLAVFQGGTTPTPPTPEDTIAVYRLYNTATSEHLLTSSANEVSQLTKGDWILDGYDKNPSGIAFYALPNTESGVPVYRVYDYGTGTHMYTTSLHEVTVLVNRDGWHWDNNEQPIFTTPTTSSYPVYRLYNPSMALNVSHLWTASWNEFNTLRNLTGNNKWDPEPNESGVAWFSCGVPTGPNV